MIEESERETMPSLTGFIILCSLLGISQALAESVFMGLCGINLKVEFILLNGFLYIVFGAIAGCGLWLVIKSFFHLSPRGFADRLAKALDSTNSLKILILGYSLIVVLYGYAITVLRNWQRGGEVILPGFVYLLGVAAIIWVFRGGSESLGRRVIFILTAMFLAVGTKT